MNFKPFFYLFNPTNYNILIVEDSTSLVKIIDSTFKTLGFNTHFAMSLKEAREKIENLKIDYVILDINLPDGHGYDLIKELSTSNVKIIVLTSQTDSQLKEVSYQKGVMDFINKDKNFLYKISEIPNLIKQIEKNRFKTVLIVDDSFVVREQIKDILTNRNYNVIEAVNATEALEKISTNRVDLMLLDLSLDGLSGYDFLVKHKKLVLEEQKIKVVFITGNINSNLIRDAFRLGVKEIIKKPYVIEELILKIDLFINDKDVEDEMICSKKLLEQYKNVLDKSNIVLKSNKNKIITYANEKFYKISGFTEEELIGKHYDFIKKISSNDDSNIEKMWECLENKEIWKGQISNIFKDNKIHHFVATVMPILNSNNEIVEYMSVRKDITNVIHLHQEIEETQREIIYKMGEVAEIRSHETGNHVKRVAQYSKLLGQLYGLSNKECDILFTASPMHDIGKIGVPDSILNKAGKLDENEWKIMRKHCVIGYNILKNSKREILKAAVIVAMEHHEKWDGSGYPRGLKGENIHIYGRITAVADVFDALGSDRCYKKAWEDEKIFELLKNEKGKHFDPKLIDLFFENIDKFKEISSKYKD